MEIAVIIAIITSSLTAILSIASILIGVVERKKQNRISVIAGTRLKYLEQIRKANAEFSGRTDPMEIRCCSSLKNQNYPVDLCVAMARLKSYLKPFYILEAKVLEKAEILTKVCLEQYSNLDIDLTEKIDKLRESYDKLFAQYDWSFWEFIKLQYDGKNLDNSLNFNAVYENTKKSIDNSSYIWEE